MTFTLAVPPGTAAQAVEDAEAREAQPAHDLAGQGHLLRLWALPGAGRALGLWQARDAAEMEAILESLPLDPWMTVDTTPLSPHPSDPAIIHPPATAPTERHEPRRARRSPSSPAAPRASAPAWSPPTAGKAGGWWLPPAR